MSTISQTPKINNARTLNALNVNLIVVAALLVTIIAIFNAVAGSSAAKPMDHSAYMFYRQGEWLSVPISNQAAYQLFRLGEMTSVNIPAVGLSAYRLSEQTMTDPNAGLAMFHLSERTLTDPRAGLASYLQSERTMIPALFTKFQLSEWFGQ